MFDSLAGDSCSAVDLSYHNKSDLTNYDAEKYKSPDSHGPNVTNSVSTQFFPSLGAIIGNSQLVQALAMFASVSGAREDPGIPDFQTSNKYNLGVLQKAATAPSRDPSFVEITTSDAKQSARIRKPESNGKMEMLCCSFCDYSCTLKCTFNVHMMKHDSSKQFTCSECNYTTSRSSDLKKHVRIHTGEKPYKCELCDYKSTEQGALRKHMLTHNCASPHCCTLCEYVSPRIGDLKRHMYIHSDKKPHVCQHCDYKTAQLPRLRKHMLIHTGQKPYQCTYCGYRCREPRNLKTHIRTHTGEKPYSCPHCQYKAGRLGTLRRHVTSIHPPDDSSAPELPRHFLESGDDQDEQSVREVS